MANQGLICGIKGALMNGLEVFLLGMMAAWTPSLLVLAWALWRAPTDPSREERQRRSIEQPAR
jgi:hypothetical protein